jgi:hypothetical protein
MKLGEVIVANEPNPGDGVFLELGETLLETHILGVDQDSIILEADAKMLVLLDMAGAFNNNLSEAEYRGRKVPLGKRMQGDVKKFKVYVKGPKGNVVKVNFGDPNMRIKKSNPARRRSFRARHRCDNPGPRWKARYWSCRAW